MSAAASSSRWKTRLAPTLRFLLLSLSCVYFGVLVAWLGVRYGLGDRTAWLYVLNALALFLFLPLPLLVPVAWWLRRRALWAGIGLAGLLWLSLWGVLFLPRLPSEDPQGTRLVVMSYNLAGGIDPPTVAATIRAGNADVVGLQELGPAAAAYLDQELAGEYAYRQLEGAGGTRGAGVLSRYPFQPTGERIPDEDWVSPTHILSLDVDGRQVVLIRFHATAFPRNYAKRERQARKLAAYAANQQAPLILFGDLNATSTNVAYEVIADVLEDSWREAGWGFGHTFPGADDSVLPGSARPEVFGLSTPKWMVRIDYVFHSRHFEAVKATAGPWDGRSDHRATVAELVLKP